MKTKLKHGSLGSCVQLIFQGPGYQPVLRAPSRSRSLCGPGSADERVSSSVCHTGRPLLRCSVCVPGDAALLFKAEESRGLMCQHPGFPPGRRSVNVIPKKKALTLLWGPFFIFIPVRLFILGGRGVCDRKHHKTIFGSCCFDDS